ncbi:3-phosphoserine/phosphohydroxythreonine transaminase [bacterium]|nr:3-phosphoserine/phosphohydroxythreonine transaminase [bacterium]
MTTLQVPRKFNFSAGPAVLPLEVLQETSEALFSLGKTGIGVMEHSHRGKPFVAVLAEAEALAREVMGISSDYAVLFLQGGASQQFIQVPMNLLQGGTADYLETGVWSEKAIKEAKRYGTVNIASTSKAENHTFIPKTHKFTAGSKFTHFTSNNTIFGTQFRGEPTGALSPLVVDASSDICSKPIDVSKYGIIYAGAQKNLGPAGVTLVVIRKDLAEQGAKDIPQLFQYGEQIKNESCYNTCPTFSIYVVSRVFAWIKRNGGLAGMAAHNEAKAKVLYDCLDSSDFWKTPVAKEDRSLMNVVFRLPSEELEEKLIKEATAAGFDGLKGHRSVGGLRASIYNAMPKEGVTGLVSFMKEFEAKNG